MKWRAMLFGIFLGLVAVLGAYRHFLSEDDFVELIKQGRLDERWSSIASNSIKTLLSGTKYEESYSLNRYKRGSELSIYVFDTRISALRSRQYMNSCGYLPNARAIVCDVKFVDEFLQRRDIDKEIVPFEGDRSTGTPFVLREASAESYDEARRFMIDWVLGHELGHYVSGHSYSHFAPNAFNEKAEPRSISQLREVEADRFVASKLNPRTPEGLKFFMHLMYMLNVEIKMKACPGSSPLQLCDKINPGVGILLPNIKLWFSSKESHPEYVIRIFRMIKQIHEKYGVGGVGYLNDQITEFLNEEK